VLSLLFGSLFTVRLFACHILWRLGAIEFDKKKVEGHIAELVRSSALVVFYLSFFFVFHFSFLFFSLFSYKLKIAKKQLENQSLRD